MRPSEVERQSARGSRSSLVVGVVVGAIGSAGAAQAAPPAGMSTREAPIVDGRRATEAERFGTVALVYTSDGEVWCTGTLIAPRVVLTAAHCVVEQDLNTDAVTRRMEPSEIMVVAGPLDAAAATEADVREVERIALHPGFPNDAPSDDPTGGGRYDDLAVVVLASPVTALSPVVIPTPEAAQAGLVAGAQLTITGYGTLDADGKGGGVLYIAQTPFQRILDHELVAGAEGSPDTCPGDSGGPAYLVVDGVAELVGVTSRGSANVEAICGEGGLYGFAPLYRDWVARVSGGLYAPDAPLEPPPEPACDPATEDCGESCDPATEDCGEACDPATEDCGESCDPATEDCGEASEGGCSGGAGVGLGGLGVLALWRRGRRRAAGT
jgi:trypsin